MSIAPAAVMESPRNANANNDLTMPSPTSVCDDTWYPLAAADAKVFFACHTGLKTYLKVLILKHKIWEGGGQKFTIKAISWHFQLNGGRRIGADASP
jgi:hypothetical protein